jgi:hypothetical protein
MQQLQQNVCCGGRIDHAARRGCTRIRHQREGRSGGALKSRIFFSRPTELVFKTDMRSFSHRLVVLKFTACRCLLGAIVLPAMLALPAVHLFPALLFGAEGSGSPSTQTPPGSQVDRSEPPGSASAAASSPVPSTKALNPRILFITAKDSPACDLILARLRQSGGEFEKMQSQGWRIGLSPDNHLQIVDRESIPELVQKLHHGVFPVVACVSEGEIVRSFQSGCTTPLDAWTFGWLAKGIDERPHEAVLEVAQVESTGRYPLRGNHWSIDGDWNPSRESVISHLRSAHSYQVAAYGAIETWSFEELRSLHDNVHEAEGGQASYSGSMSGGRSTASSRGGQSSAGQKILGH